MNDPRFSSIVAALPEVVPFVPPEALERRTGRPLALRMGANESPYGSSPRALAAMSAAAKSGNLYNDPEGFALRSAIACAHGVGIENVILGAGIDDLLMLLCRTFLDPGDAVVTSLGGYPTFNYGVASVGGVLVTTAYKHDKNDLAGLAELAKVHRPKLVYLANPDNPSGSWYRPAEILAFRSSLPSESVLLLDQAYGEFAPENAEFSMDDAGVIRLRTFSKAYGMAGLRVGYALVSVGVAKAFNKHRPHFGVNNVAQAGALASIADHEWLEQVVKETGAARGRLASIARSVGLIPLDSHTNFVSMDAGSRGRADSVLAGLAERDVFIRKPGTPPLDRCVRVTVALDPELDLFAEILGEVVRQLPDPTT